MAISQRLRFEILRRDGYTCSYCGAAAPDVALAVDHVTPIALGGSDGPSNLVTSCKECNSGKSSIAPDSPIVSDVIARSAAWNQALAEAAQERADQYKQMCHISDEFHDLWNRWHHLDAEGQEHPVHLPASWREQIHYFLDAGLTIHDLSELIDVSMSARARSEWAYLCGCCFNRVHQAQERASEIMKNRGTL